MAEVKNSFLKSKMNKDLDDRLIPNGEYRDAVNIQVSRSEGEDVGALENVLGNFELSNIGNDQGYDDIKCIGYCVDDSKNNVYMFFTNYLDNFAFGANPVFSPLILDSGGSKYFHGIYVYNTNTNQLKLLVTGIFLNFSQNKPILGVNILEDVLFWTDDRNQPRKINVKKAKDNYQFYNNEDKISVAKYYPYQSPLLIKETEASTPENPVYETTMYDAVSPLLPDGSDNPYRENEFPGDPRYLEDKFIRFSYRFKFKDGEYSLIAPFTQPCFIPKQDGYFLVDDEKTTISSTVVSFMENKVNKIKLQIPLPYDAEDMESSLDIEEIDVIYKESDGISLKVVETIPVSDLSGSDRVYEYEYLSQKPYKTLPEDEVFRVYDKVPVKAFAQEVVSNRVVYANFQDKHTPPKSLNYQVSGGEKYEFDAATVDFNANSTIEYPNHSLKENRNYQVGVVLSDRYGRQSTVILSNNKLAADNGFGADTLYLPYRVNEDSISFFGNSLKMIFNEKIESEKNAISGKPGLYSETNPLGWYSYKIVVKQLEQDYYNVYTSGAIKGNPEVNTEQLDSSFIVLINDNINKIPRDLSEVGPQDKSFRSSVRLFGRVENTAQEISSVGNKQYFPGNRTFTTNVIEDLFDIFDVAEAVSNHPITDISNPYYTFLRGESNPFIGEFITSQTETDQFGVANVNSGSGGTYVKTQNLAILETAPTTSVIDIYYETSTSGLLSELNTAVDTDFDGAVGLNAFVYNHSEGDPLNHKITENFSFVDADGNVLAPIPGVDGASLSVTDSLGNDRSADFTLVRDLTNSDEFYIQTNDYFYFGEDGVSKENYAFKLKCTTGIAPITIDSPDIIVKGQLQNATPSIDNNSDDTIVVTIGKYLILDDIQGRNGSNDTNQNTNIWRQDLVWQISDTPETSDNDEAPEFQLVEQNGLLRVVNNNPGAAGTYTFRLNIRDLNGNTVNSIPYSEVFTINFDIVETDDVITDSTPSGGQYEIRSGEGIAVWFTNDNNNLLGNNAWEDEPVFATGLDTQGLSLGGTKSVSIAPSCSNSFSGRSFKNISRYDETNGNGAFTKGYFYVFVSIYNGYTNGGNTYTVGSSLDISYRKDSSQPWNNALDMLNIYSGGQSAGNWLWEGSTTGMYAADGTYQPTYGGVPYGGPFPMTASCVNNVGTASRVLAFSIPGEYRITLGNLITSYPTTVFTVDVNGNVVIDCDADQQVDGVARAYMKFGDLYHVDDEDIKQNSSQNYTYNITNRLPEGVYEYFVTEYDNSDPDGGCGDIAISDASYTVFAKEPFAKYVTQLYEWYDLATKAGFTTQKRYRIQRVIYKNSNNPEVHNPENVKNGSYKLVFDVKGRRVPEFSDAEAMCLYPSEYYQ